VLAEAAGYPRGAPGVTVDYVEVLDPDTLAPPDGHTRGGRRRRPGPTPEEAGDVHPRGDRLLVAVAAHVGPVRLIDNVESSATRRRGPAAGRDRP
jgi:pantoate--beta-alanine ligase